MYYIKLLMKQVKSHPRIIIFLFTAYMISALLISIWTSNSLQLRNEALEKTKGMVDNAVEIQMKFNEKIGFSNIINMIDKINDKTNIHSEVTSFLDYEKMNISIQLEHFKKEPLWRPSLISGRSYTQEEIEDGNNVVMLGRSLEKFTYKNEGIIYINIQNEPYEVIGILGNKNKTSSWDEAIFMPLKSIPDSMKINFDGERTIRLYLNNEYNLTIEDYKLLDKMVKDINGEINFRELDIKNDIVLTNISNPDKIVFLAVFIYIIALLNIVNINNFWIDDRKEELAIRKAFGMTNIDISFMLFSEIFTISLISTLIGIVIQYIINLFSLELLGASINISFYNFIVGIMLSTITSVIVAIIPIIKMLRLHPVEIFKS